MTSEDRGEGAGRKRERSHKYPRRNLSESLDLVKFIEDRGLDGFPAGEIATSLGFSNIKSNTFSATLSAARQFGLLESKAEEYRLTALARSILHPVSPAERLSKICQSFRLAPLYEELAHRFEGKVVPEVSSLANLLLHQFEITVGAKDLAATVFLESARFAGVLGPDGILRLEATVVEAPEVKVPKRPKSSTSVRLDLRLWGRDEGKMIRLRAPEKITKESYDRLLQALALLVQIES